MARVADDVFALAEQAAAEVARRTGVAGHDVFVVLGSGWVAAAEAVSGGVTVPTDGVPGFRDPSGAGHRGQFRSVTIGTSRVLIALGRLHLYEGHSANTVAHAVRTAAATGCRTVVLTNAAGSLNPAWKPGSMVLIRDQINLTGHSPMTGCDPSPPFSSRFVDLTDLYSARLRALARDVQPGLPEGVYIGMHGPEFETPAEIRAAAAMGADLCGMSTVLEAIAARHLGLEVLGLSLVTNLAAGLAPGGLDLGHVLAVAEDSGPAAGDLLVRLVERLVTAG